MAGLTPEMSTSLGSGSEIRIHSVIGGPFTPEDMEEYWDGPPESEAYLVVKVEHNGEVQDVEWYFATIDESYEWIKHFKKSIDPIIITGAGTYG